MAPRTGVSSTKIFASLGHSDGEVRSVSICGVSSSMASMHGPSPARRSSSSICWASRSLAPTVTYRSFSRTIRLAWSQPRTVSVAAMQIAAYICLASEPW